MVNKALEIKEEFKLTRIDWFLVPAVFAGFGLWIFFNIYSAINWDDLQYMSQAQFTFPDARILNRYGHIYLLKIFYIFGGPILGARIFWCFMFTATSIFTYWSSKILWGKNGTFAAIMAVVMIWFWPLFGREAGSPLTDFTVMMLVSASIFIYLAFLKKRTKYSHWLIALLGFIFFWAVKSKETGICLIVLFLGLGRINDKFSFKQFIKDSGWALAGFIAGSLVLMTCDLIFMGDFLFSIKLSSMKGLADVTIGPPVNPQEPDIIIESWFSYLTTRSIFLVFVLYVLAGISSLKNYTIREKLIWIMPLLLLIFLTFSRRAWYIVPRYISPVMPVMTIWASQFFLFDTEGKFLFKSNFSISKKAAGIIAAVAAFMAAPLFAFKIRSIALYYKFYELETLPGFPNVRYERMSGEELCVYLVVLPVVISGILVTLAVAKKKGLAAFFFISLFSFALILPSYNSGRKLMETAVLKSTRRFEACRAFKDDFKFDENTKILVSTNIFHGGTFIMGRDAEAHCHIFNIYFKQKLEYKQFIDGKIEDIPKGGYTYAILLTNDFAALQNNPAFAKLLAGYEMKADNTLPLILLKSKAALGAK